jgi:hypothetical protein
MANKLPPDQSKLLATMADGRDLVRDCGLYWLRKSNHPTGQQIEAVSTAIVNALIANRVIKSDEWFPEQRMENFSIDKTKL